MYHGQLGKKIIVHLCDALSTATPRKFVCFKNWRHVQVKVHVQNAPSDSTFFTMKFFEWYDGDGHGAIQKKSTLYDNLADFLIIFLYICFHVLMRFFLQGNSKELRAEMLYYLTYHSENKVFGELPEELLQFRIDDYHPYFY
jgi:hypothetical protein